MFVTPLRLPSGRSLCVVALALIHQDCSFRHDAVLHEVPELHEELASHGHDRLALAATARLPHVLVEPAGRLALGLEPEGMVRVGLLHYNTADEIDRLAGDRGFHRFLPAT